MEKEPIAAWCSDIHMNFLHPKLMRKFLAKVRKIDVPLIISGDITSGHVLTRHLGLLANACKTTVYFVTGNHDYYHSSFSRVDEVITQATHDHPNLVYLPHSGLVKLNDDTCILGPEGWYDGRSTSGLGSTYFGMSDFLYIEEFREVNRQPNPERKITNVMQTRADAALFDLKLNLSKAEDAGFKNIILVSHPVPFLRMTSPDSDLSPFYVWHDAGQYVGQFLCDKPNMKLLWLAGHTHEESEYSPLHNMTCLSQHCVYSLPKIDRIVNSDLSVVTTKTKGNK